MPYFAFFDLFSWLPDQQTCPTVFLLEHQEILKELHDWNENETDFLFDSPQDFFNVCSLALSEVGFF